MSVTCDMDALVEMVRAGRLVDAQHLLGADERGATTGRSLRASVLGPVSISCDGTGIVRWHSRRGLAVLKYLLLNRRRPVSRERLMAQFWPDADTDRARNCLNVAVHGLRKSLRGGAPGGGDVVVLVDGCYAIAPGVEVWLDHDELLAAVGAVAAMRAAGDLEDAVGACEAAEALYRGRLFEGDPLEDWFLVDLQAAADALVDVLHHHGSALLDMGRAEEAVTVGHRILRAERTCERGHLLLMRAHQQLGHTHRALRQYAECSQVLADDLGVGPGSEVESLRRRLAS